MAPSEQSLSIGGKANVSKTERARHHAGQISALSKKQGVNALICAQSDAGPRSPVPGFQCCRHRWSLPKSPYALMADIFVSHATADKALARLLVDLLKEGIGVPGSAIFCSSLKGHGVPFTADFNHYMKDQIQQPKLVFLLMTPAYLESSFCLMELGAAWAKSLKALAIVVPPVGFDVVTKTLGLKAG
ncbi:toll/interleukin-1 receptor domain-containing protein [Altererythrobacter sp. KTW20L]|uniref:toll/interleukin-1 receptor domain-containing protein n=1 Tax=Altererythrobacter sp. KTW20L TaxID=2942210 RepID=UPI0020C129BC|nr:toll/interleukin-1 receptor domain-containing protein [Altererythrobacter sp. KTW20L]